MATRASRAKTSAELKIQLENAKKKLIELEQKAYAEELNELIMKTNIVKDFKTIQEKVTDIKPIAIIKAISHAVGMRRVEITQAEAPKRKPVDPNKPKKPRAKKTT